MEDPARENVYCSELSLQADEPLGATATHTTQFLLLEYNGAWGGKAFEESELPAELKAHLNAYAYRRPECKILLIRSPRSLAEPGVRFFAAQMGEGKTQVIDFHFDGYDDILRVDLEALFRGEYASHARHSPVYLVCTHGRRDRCCSRFGIPVYNALLDAARFEDEEMGVWQSSHIGGHRFAANLISLSSGLLYGRVAAGDVCEILAAERRGELRLENVRGRLAYAQPAQAAELALRKQIGEIGLRALRLEDLDEIAPQSWVARFAHEDGRRFRVLARAQETETRIYESCSMDKTTPLVNYQIDIETL